MLSISKNSVTRLVLLGFLITKVSCNHADQNRVEYSVKQNFPKMSFDETAFDFGAIQSGDTITHIFKFKNTGRSPLVINDISASCGCTAAEWSKAPISPNQSGQIKITFSKRHDPGIYQKTAIIKANTADPYTVLRIQAEVKG